MRDIIVRSLRTLLKARLTIITLVAAIGVGVGVAWAIANTTGSATSQGRGPAADTSERPLTPFRVPTMLPTPVPGANYPGQLPPDEVGCAGPENEVPAPGLPPLPCHDRSSEPVPGAIPTPDAAERDDAVAATQNVPEGWIVYDNPMFRYTFALPPGWYANMRPEGGEFDVFDPIGMEQFATQESRSGGLVMLFFAGTSERDKPNSRGPKYTEGLDSPNARFGTYGGAIWENPEDPEIGEGVVRIIRFAFARSEGLFFGGQVNFGEGYTEADVETVYRILKTITPY